MDGPRARQDEFVHLVAHDLKAPLRAVENLAQWIEEDLGHPPSPALAEHLGMMHRRLARLRRLIDQLVEYAEAGAAGEAPVPLELGPLLLEAVQSVEPRPGIRVAVAPGAPALTASAGALRRVVTLLVANAVRHHDKAQGRVKVTAADGKSLVTVTVEDDGPGIESRHLERIFEVCQTLQPKDESEGSGVGLAIVQRILQGHGGRVSVESTPGQGSRFLVEWPKGA